MTVLSRTAISAGVIAVTYLLMLSLEHRRPLRRSVEPKLRRVIRNFTTAGLSLALVTLLQLPILIPVSQWTTEHRFGVVELLPGPRVLQVVAGVVLLDYTLWFWHWANHVVPFLWRFHLVHHADLDMDASTALRFHFGEQGLSVFYRCAQILAIGADPLTVWIWQLVLFVSILFHHSNARLPIGLERALVRLLVTPRMHGIHHSNRRSEATSNFSSLLAWWDYAHRTLLLNVPQQELVIGVAAYEDPRELSIGRILALPFRRQREAWRSRDGNLASRPHAPEERARLLA